MGFCHLTDSQHYHHGQKPTMVAICHGGNMPVGHYHDHHGHDDHAQSAMLLMMMMWTATNAFTLR